MTTTTGHTMKTITVTITAITMVTTTTSHIMMTTMMNTMRTTTATTMVMSTTATITATTMVMSTTATITATTMVMSTTVTTTTSHITVNTTATTMVSQDSLFLEPRVTRMVAPTKILFNLSTTGSCVAGTTKLRLPRSLPGADEIFVLLWMRSGTCLLFFAFLCF